MEATCRICKQTKPLEAFDRAARNRNGRDSRCKACKRAAAQVWKTSPIDFGTKVCTACGVEKDVTEFGTHVRRKDGRSSMCRVCHRKQENDRYHADPVWAWEKNTLKRMGLTAESYNALLEDQGGGCAICGKAETAANKYGIKRLAVDHDHTCCPPRRACDNCRRGLLCSACNVALGAFQDDPDLLEAAAAYLRACRGAPQTI